MDKTPDPMAQIEALEQKLRGEPVVQPQTKDDLIWRMNKLRSVAKDALKLCRALAAQPGQGEPKGWLCTQRGCPDVIVRSEKRAKAWAVEGFTVEPLYATPPTPTHDEAGVRADVGRLDWLDTQRGSYGTDDVHEGNAWVIEGPFNTIREAIDSERAALLGEKS